MHITVAAYVFLTESIDGRWSIFTFEDFLV